MPDGFYRFVCSIGRPIFYACASPVVLHADRLDRGGPMIIAPNHLSAYDVPCIMASTYRLLDFVSIVEIFQHRLAGWFLGSMNAFPLDRRRVDSSTTREIFRRLERGRIIVMFPEGRIQTPANSMLHGGRINPSMVRLAQISSATIIPCVVLGTGRFRKPMAWLPFQHTRYGVAFGEPVNVPYDSDAHAARSQTEVRLRKSYDELYAELRAASGLSVND